MAYNLIYINDPGQVGLQIITEDACYIASLPSSMNGHEGWIVRYYGWFEEVDLYEDINGTVFAFDPNTNTMERAD